MPETPTIIAPFDMLSQQPSIAALLSDAASKGSLSHAYLLVGPNGSGKTDAAMAIALSRICLDGGCCECDECGKVLRRSHPDVHWIEPEGSSYLVDQIRDVTHQAALSPVRANHKIFIVTAAQALNPASANAFLKTLEEPLDNTSFVLMSPSKDSVLDTISSRCQVVAFSSVTQSRSIEFVMKETRRSASDAKMALAIKGGSSEQAVELLLSSDRMTIVRETVGAMEEASRGDVIEMLSQTQRVLSAVKGACKDMEETYNNSIEEQGDFLSKGAVSSLKKKHKRLVTNSERELLDECFAVMRYWLRNRIIDGIGCEGLAIDFALGTNSIDSRLQPLGPEAFVKAQEAIDEAQRQIAFNVTPQLALEAGLMKIREVLHASRHSG